MKIDNYIFFIICCLGIQLISAQQAPQYTQYMYNTQVLNPAYAGSRGELSITPLYRAQWNGIDGAPKTQSLTLSSPIGRREKVGLGLSIVNDNVGNGTSATTDFGIDFSYGIRASKNGKLALGLSASARFITTDLNKLRNFQPSFLTDGFESIQKRFDPNVGIGAYYYTSNFYVGLSIPRLLSTEFFEANEGSNTFLAEDNYRLYGILGWVCDIGRGWKFKPALLVNTMSAEPMRVDVSANFMFKNQFVVGAAYRLKASVSLLTAFQFTDHLLIGIAYDRETTALGGIRFNDGSFESFLRYELRSRRGKRVDARFF